MRPWRAAAALIVVVVMIGFLPNARPAPVSSATATSDMVASTAVTPTAPAASAPLAEHAPAAPPPSLANTAFADRVRATARALASAGVAPDRYSLPWIGASPEIVNGAVVPGPLVANSLDSGAQRPAPQGIAYYGENDTSGVVQTTAVRASSVIGQLTVNQWSSLYFETNTPPVAGIQLNAVLTNVTLQGTAGYQYWTQNALDYNWLNNTLSLGDDVWNLTGIGNFTPPTAAIHSPNGSVVGGVYIGTGPTLRVPRPFNLTLFLNSSVTASGDQELWMNYTVAASGQTPSAGTFDWIIFNSSGLTPSTTTPVAPFLAEGSGVVMGLETVYDYEFDIGIGAFNGASLDVLSANLSASLSYCPAADRPCSASDVRPVPAAMDFGDDTGETGVGLAFTYHGTTAYATAGPSTLRGLWGFSGYPGSTPGSVAVANDLSVSGSPVPGSVTPYLFVFFDDLSRPYDLGYAWAPDVPEWFLPPGSYAYVVALADYAEQTGTLTVSSGPTALAATLSYSTSSGVYTPLWAFNNSELAGISSQGAGTLTDQYLLFNDPTTSCTACGGASAGNLSGLFFSSNDYAYPTFPGLLLAGTSAYVDVRHPVAFLAGWATYFEAGHPNLTVPLDLPMVLYRTQHVTLQEATIGAWPAMFPLMMIETVPPAQNPFPQGDVIVWDSSSDLIMTNRFSGAASLGPYSPGLYPPDELLFYGGSNNTVWGNAFLDPAGASLCSGACATYAGLAEGESGDLVYNNYFAVDNPTMYMAYDIVNDSCWAGWAGLCFPLVLPTYADLWNVTNQSAQAVSDVVNGFSLSGNVLGPAYAWQGGNYWWNWGDPLNPYGTIPYVNVFNYTDYRTNLPPGSTEHEASIRAGGDGVPLYAPGVHLNGSAVFSESGLPASALKKGWTVELGGVVRHVQTSSVALPNLLGDDGYVVTGPSGYVVNGSLPSGTLSVGAVGASEQINFVRGRTVSLTFSQSGLGKAASWCVELGGWPVCSDKASHQYRNLTLGNYAFAVVSPLAGQVITAKVGKALLTVSNGTSVTVDLTKGATVALTFVYPYEVTFTQLGLSSGSWTMTIKGHPETAAWDDPIVFSLGNGTYAYKAGKEAGFVAPHGKVHVHGGSLSLSVTFTAAGRPALPAPSVAGSTLAPAGRLARKSG